MVEWNTHPDMSGSFSADLNISSWEFHVRFSAKLPAFCIMLFELKIKI